MGLYFDISMMNIDIILRKLLLKTYNKNKVCIIGKNPIWFKRHDEGVWYLANNDFEPFILPDTFSVNMLRKRIIDLAHIEPFPISNTTDYNFQYETKNWFTMIRFVVSVRVYASEGFFRLSLDSLDSEHSIPENIN